MKTTHRGLNGWWQALSELGARFAPTLPADIKTGRLLTPVKLAFEPIAHERARIANRLMQEKTEEFGVKTMEELPKSVQRMLENAIVLAQLEWEQQEIEVAIPEGIRITQNDLPKERTGDEGWKNGAGLGGIISELGDLFELPKE